MAGKDLAVLDVPYWSWLSQVDEIRERLATDANVKFPFVWPLVRDDFRLCHALISKNDFCIPDVPNGGDVPHLYELPTASLHVRYGGRRQLHSQDV